jgi:hypothetical protein
VNQAPIFTGPDTRYVYAGNQITFMTAIDLDLPLQDLLFSFGPGAPPGADLDAGSGLFSWTPTAQQAGATYYATVLVSDDATPPLHSARTYAIHVLAPDSNIIIATIFRRDNLVEIAWPSRPGRAYRVEYRDTLDQTEWTALPGIINAVNGACSKIDPNPANQQRFYHVVLLP